jgi:hypothetical protein
MPRNSVWVEEKDCVEIWQLQGLKGPFGLTGPGDAAGCETTFER